MIDLCWFCVKSSTDSPTATTSMCYCSKFGLVSAPFLSFPCYLAVWTFCFVLVCDYFALLYPTPSANLCVLSCIHVEFYKLCLVMLSAWFLTPAMDNESDVTHTSHSHGLMNWKLLLGWYTPPVPSPASLFLLNKPTQHVTWLRNQQCKLCLSIFPVSVTQSAVTGDRYINISEQKTSPYHERWYVLFFVKQ